MSDSFSSKPWTIVMDGDDFHIHHDTDDKLSAADAIVAMPRWAPKLIRALFDRVNELRRQVALIAAGTAETVIRPISTAPRGPNERYDIWYKRYETAPPARIPDAMWSEYCTRWNAPSDCRERFHGWTVSSNGTHSRSYLEKDGVIVGWSPIPTWKDPR